MLVYRRRGRPLAPLLPRHRLQIYLTIGARSDPFRLLITLNKCWACFQTSKEACGAMAGVFLPPAALQAEVARATKHLERAQTDQQVRKGRRCAGFLSGKQID